MTRATRWLILMTGGTLLFGVLCFGSGLLLGPYLWGAAPHLAGAARPALPAAVAAKLPGGAARSLATPGAAQNTVAAPGNASKVAAVAARPIQSDASPTGGGAGTSPHAAGAPAPLPTAPPAVATTAAAAAAFPVKSVDDLQVGLPADEQFPSVLRGGLVREAAVAAKPGMPEAGPKMSAGAGAAAANRAFAIRAGAYLDADAAQRRAEFLKERGYTPLILSSRQPEEGLTWYSVVLDPTPDWTAAQRAGRQFAHDEQQSAEIVSWSLTLPAPPAAVPATAAAK